MVVLELTASMNVIIVVARQSDKLVSDKKLQAMTNSSIIGDIVGSVVGDIVVGLNVVGAMVVGRAVTGLDVTGWIIVDTGTLVMTTGGTVGS